MGVSLVRGPGCLLTVAMSHLTLMYAARFEQHDSREYLSGASNRRPERHRIQNVEGPVLDPCRKQMYLKRVPKWTLLSESGPSWRVCFWPLYFIRCAKALQAAKCANFKLEATLTQTASAAGILNCGGPCLRF